MSNVCTGVKGIRPSIYYELITLAIAFYGQNIYKLVKQFHEDSGNSRDYKYQCSVMLLEKEAALSEN